MTATFIFLFVGSSIVYLVLKAWLANKVWNPVHLIGFEALSTLAYVVFNVVMFVATMLA